ncbi:phosphohydrolase [Deinococcus wulumuqiensis]
MTRPNQRTPESEKAPASREGASQGAASQEAGGQQRADAGAHFRLSVAGGKAQDIEGKASASSLSDATFTTPRAKLIEEANQAIQGDLEGYPRALAAYEALRGDPEARAHWDMANYVTMRKLGYNDHGRVHAFITGAASMAITELLLDAGVRPDLMESGVGDADDVFLTVILGTMLHDIGNQIHRTAHEQHGVALALPILERILTPIYPDPFKRTKVRSFILGAINCHDLNPAPLTIEGGITALADGTDITKGRGRKAFSLGSVDIHSISALAVDQVVIRPGRERPVRIDVTMNNSGGIFQVEEVLAPKVIRTPLRPYVELRASMRGEGGEEPILSRVRLEGDQFVMDLDTGEQVTAEVQDTQKRVAEAVAANLNVGSERG